MVPTLGRSGRDKITETIKRSAVARSLDTGVGGIGRAQGFLGK